MPPRKLKLCPLVDGRPVPTRDTPVGVVLSVPKYRFPPAVFRTRPADTVVETDVAVVAPSAAVTTPPFTVDAPPLAPVIQKRDPSDVVAARTLLPVNASVPSMVEVSTLPAPLIRPTTRGTLADDVDATDPVPGDAE